MTLRRRHRMRIAIKTAFVFLTIALLAASRLALDVQQQVCPGMEEKVAQGSR